MPSFITNLKASIPEEKLAWIVAALRQDQIIWESLQDESFSNKVIAFAGSDLALWSPASIANLALNSSISLDQLQDPKFKAASPKVRTQAANVFEELAYPSGDLNPQSISLEQAGLLAIALRERRRVVGSWEDIDKELKVAPLALWLTPIACLVGILPDPNEFLLALLGTREDLQFHKLVLHALLSVPNVPEKLTENIYDLVNSDPINHGLKLLRPLAHQRSDVASLIAKQLLADTSIQDDSPTNNLESFQFLLWKAEMLQISQQYNESHSVLESTWNIIDRLKTNRSANLAISAAKQNKNDLANNILEEIADKSWALSDPVPSLTLAKLKIGVAGNKSEGKIPDSNGKQDPVSLLANSVSALKLGNKDSAKSYVLQAFDLSQNDAPKIGEESQNYLPMLLDQLIKLEIFEEAQQCAILALEFDPNDSDLLLKLSQILLRNHDLDQATEIAQLGVALQPNDLDTRRHLIDLLVENHVWDNAFQELEILIAAQDSPLDEDQLSLAACSLHLDKAQRAADICLDLLNNGSNNNVEAHAILGEANFLLGDTPQALDHLKIATELSPSLAQPWLKLAELHEQQGDIKSLLNTLTSGTKAVPDDARLFLALGKAYQLSDKDSQALEAFKKAGKMLPSITDGAGVLSEEISIQLATALQQAKKPDLARLALEKSYNAYPARPAIAHAYGKLLIDQEDYQSALAPLDVACKSLPEDPEVQLNYARALIALNQDAAGAQSALQKALDIEPNNPIALALLAEATAQGDDPKRALRLYEDALESDLAQDAAWQKQLSLGLANAAIKLGQPIIAIEQLKKAQNQIEINPAILQSLSEAYYQANMFEDSLESARQAYSLSPEDKNLLSWFADQTFKLDATDDAIGALEKAYTVNPQDTELLVRIGQLQFQNNNLDAAKESFDKLYQAENVSVDDLSSAADEFTSRGDIHQAIKYLERAEEISSQPQSQDLLQELFSAYQQIDNTDSALKVLNKSIDLSPDDPDLLTAKANMLLGLGRTQDAMDSIKKSLKLNPDNTQLHHSAASILRRSGDLLGANEHIEQALKLNAKSPAIRYLAGEIAYANLNTKLASEILSKQSWTVADFNSAELGQMDIQLSDALQLYAEIVIEQGNIKKAKQLVDLVPDAGNARQLAIQARLAQLSGNTSEAKKFYEQAVDQSTNAPEDNIDPIAVSTSQLSIAKAAYDLGKWNAAVDLFSQVAFASNTGPSAHFNLAKAIVKRAEFERICTAVEAIHYAPGADSLGEDAKQQFEEAIDLALQYTNHNEAENEIKHWRVRGNDVFSTKATKDDRPISYPSNPEEAASLISTFHRNGASAKAREIAANQGQHPAILTEMALIQANEDPIEAAKTARQAADLNPTPLNQALFAKLSHQVGNTNQAIEGIEQALAAWPDEPRWHLLAGQMRHEVGEITNAVAHLRKAAELEPAYGQHHLALGKSLSELESTEEAIQSLETAVKLVPNDAEGWLALANANVIADDASQAAKHAKKAEKLDPHNPESAVINAKIALMKNQPEKAQGYIETALLANPEDPKILALLGKTLTAMNRPQEALTAVEAAISKSADPIPLLLEKAKLIHNTKGEKPALIAMKALAKEYPDNHLVLSTFSEALFEAGRVDDAIKISQHAVKTNVDALDPHDLGRLNYLLGTQLHQAGQLDQAVQNLHEATELSPHFVEAYLEIGQVHRERRNPQKALKYFEAATEIAPHDPRAFIETGLALRESKDFIGAEAMLRKAAALAPKDPAIQRSLASVVALNLVHPTSPLKAAANL